MRSLERYLSSLDQQRLVSLFERRPEATFSPVPADLAGLAARLVGHRGVVIALAQLPKPAVQLAEALTSLGDGCPRSVLAAGVGRAADDPALTGALDLLTEYAVAWPDGDLIRVVPLNRVWPHPLGLGSPVSTLLAHRPTDELQRIARELGLRPPRARPELIGMLTGWLSEPERVTALVASAPKATRTVLTKMAWEGPHLFESLYSYGGGARPASWAASRGLIGHAGGWGAPLEMACEVALALRGADYRMPFDPDPPAGHLVRVEPQDVEREAAAAAGAALVRVSAVLDECGKTPITPLKSGGVGVRELRRIARASGADEDEVRLWLEVVVSAGLVGMSDQGLVPTEEYDQWRLAQPAEQLSVLLDGWRTLTAVPLRPPAEGASREPVLTWDQEGMLAPSVRPVVLAVAADLPPGGALPSLADVVELTRWRRPLPLGGFADQTAVVSGIWREATLLGLVAHAAATDLGRAFADGKEESVRAVAQRLLPAAQETVLLQADLTAVAVGTPSGALTALLDLVADRESRGNAWTWRFSPPSMRRAFDSGMTEREVLDRLRAATSTGNLPQPLEYLIRDVARRHGSIRVRPVECCLRCDDVVLLAEIRRAKSLAKLGLTELAPTVLASAAPVAQTLAALRAAGYAPVGEQPDGTIALERAPKQRAPSQRVGPIDLANPGALRVSPEILDDLPDELLDELLDAVGLDDPAELRALMEVADRADGGSPAGSDPVELARRLLTRPAPGAARQRKPVARQPRRGRPTKR